MRKEDLFSTDHPLKRGETSNNRGDMIDYDNLSEESLIDSRSYLLRMLQAMEEHPSEESGGFAVACRDHLAAVEGVMRKRLEAYTDEHINDPDRYGGDMLEVLVWPSGGINWLNAAGAVVAATELGDEETGCILAELREIVKAVGEPHEDAIVRAKDEAIVTEEDQRAEWAAERARHYSGLGCDWDE